MACRESSLDFLRSLGYTAIHLPRERIAPLDLVGRLPGGRARLLGSLTALMVADGEVPPVTRDEVVAEISGRHTDALDVGIGLRLLVRFLSALAPVTLALDAAFERARRIEFTYEDVRSDSVDLIALRRWLGRRPPLDHTNPVIDDYFIGEGEAVVITRTLKSNRFGVTAYDEAEQRLAIDLTRQRRALAEAGVEVTQDARWKTSFRGPVRLVFAFQGFLLRIDSRGLHVSDDVPPEMGLLAVAPVLGEEVRPVVWPAHGLLRLD